MRSLVLGDSLAALIDYRGKTPKKLGADFTRAGVPVASAQLVSDGVLHLEEARTVDFDTYRKWMSTPVAKGDVLLTSEAPLGRVARVASDAPLVLGQRLFGLRGLPGVLDSGFLYYALQTEAVQSELRGRATGSTVTGIRQSALRRVAVPAPEYHEQQAIAEVLGALDDKIAAAYRVAGTANRVAGMIFDCQTGTRPRSPMASVLQPILGGTPPRGEASMWGGDVWWASAKDVTGAPLGVLLETLETITEGASNRTRARRLPAGSVILTARGTVGAVCRLGEPSAFNQSCYGFAPGEVPPATLYFYVLRAAEGARALAHGSVFDTITMQSFDHLTVPDLSSCEIDALELQLAPLLSVVDRSVRESMTLVRLRDSLLPQLMSGKIRVKDAEHAVSEVV